MLNKLTQLYHQNLLNNKTALKYLWERGIFNKSIEHFKLGYASRNIGWRFVKSRFSQKEIEYSKMFYMDTGKDKFNKRIVFPIMSNDKTYSFTSRSIVKCTKPHLHNSGSIPILYNQDDIKNFKIIITESPLDCITLWQHRFHAIATLGIVGQIKNHLDLFQDVIPYICYDYDPNQSGQKGALQAARILNKVNINPYIINFPKSNQKMDVNLFFKAYKPQDFQKLIDNAIRYSETDDYLKINTPQSYSNVNFPIEVIAIDYGMDLIPTSMGYKTICKFHADTSPSLILYKQTNSFFCFGCRRGGDAAELLRQLEIINGNYMTRKQVIQFLKSKY